MHILMTADSVGGVWTYAVTLARSLHALGVEVTLAIMGPPPSAGQIDDLRSMPYTAWYHHAGRLEWMPDGLADVASAGDWLMDLSIRIRPDVVHLNAYAPGAQPFGRPVVVVAHSCVRTWWRAVKGEPAPARFDAYTRVVAHGLAYADLVVAPSRAMLDAIFSEYAVTTPSAVIPNGSDLQPSEPPRKEGLVFAAGRFSDEAKNLELLERAADLFDWPLTVAGATGENRNITYLGWLDRPEVLAWMARAGIYAAPARYEPFGLSILEAARHGCALVVGDVPSLREVWETAAWFVAPDDVRGLAAAINALAADDRLREWRGHVARTQAAHYTSAACAEAYKRAYQALVTSRSTDALRKRGG